MNRYKLVLGFLLLVFLGETGCKKYCDVPDDPSCRNYDPCWGKDPVSAEFDLWEQMPNDTLLPAYDAVFMNRNLVLKARQDSLESYQWRIGWDTTFRTGNRTAVFFGAPYGPIEITLIVRSTPNLTCNPGDDGRDTIKKTVHVLDHPDLPIWGSYRGYEVGEENQLFTVTVRLDSVRTGYRPTLISLARGCSINHELVTGANGFFIHTGGSLDCLGTTGNAYLSRKKDTLRAVYWRFDRKLAEQNPPVYQFVDTPFTFIGIRQ